MKEKRSGSTDRRHDLSEDAHDHATVENDDYVIKDDRRSIPDRRINNIHLEEIDCEDYIKSISENDKK